MADRTLVLGVDSRGAERGYSRAKRSAREFTGEARKSAGATKNVEGAMAGLRSAALKVTGVMAGLGVTIGAGALIRGLVNSNREFERLRAQLITTEQSAEGAEAAFRRIESFAVSTPFQIENLTDAFVQLRVRGVQPTEQEMTALGNLASAFSRDITDVARAVSSAAAGESESIKRLGFEVENSGDRITLAFDGMERTVDRSASSIVAAMTELTGDRLAGAMEREMDTINGAVSNLFDNLGRLARAIGTEGGLNSAIISLVRSLNDSIGAIADNTEAIAEFGRIVGQTVRGLQRMEDVMEDIAAFANNPLALGMNLAGSDTEEDLRTTKELTDLQKQMLRTVVQRRGEQAQTEELTRLEEEAARKAAKARQKALEAAKERRELVVEALELGAEREGLLDEALDRWVEIHETLDAGGLSLEKQVELLRELADLSSALEGHMEATQRSVERMGSLDLGLSGGGIPSLGGAEADPRSFTDFLDEAAKNAEKSFSEVAREADIVSRSAIGLADNLGLLDGRARDAARAVSDIVGGLSNLQFNKEGGLDVLGSLPGIMGAVGGAIGLVDSLFGGGFDEVKAAADAQNAYNRALENFLNRARDIPEFESEMDKLLEETFDLLNKAAGASGIEVAAEEPQSVEEMLAFIDELRRAAEAMGVFGLGAGEDFIAELDKIADGLEANVERLKELRQEEIDTMKEQAQIQLLIAQGRDEEAAALERQIERQARLEKAAKLGDEGLVALLEELFRVEDASRKAAEAEAARREAIEAARQARQDQLSLAEREAALRGDDKAALQARLQAQAEAELNALQDRLEAGEISEEFFRRMSAVITGEVNQALADFEEQAKAAAEAERQRQREAEQNLQLRLLRARGMDEEAERLQDLMEIEKARRDGMSESFIEQLKTVQAAEARARAEQKAREGVEDTTRAIDGMTRVLNGPAGLPLALLRAQAAVSEASAPGIAITSGRGRGSGGGFGGAGAAGGGGGGNRLDFMNRFGGGTSVDPALIEERRRAGPASGGLDPDVLRELKRAGTNFNAPVTIRVENESGDSDEELIEKIQRAINKLNRRGGGFVVSER